MRKFLISATALTAIVLGATAASAADLSTIVADGLDAKVVQFQRLAAVPTSKGCTLVITESSGDSRFDNYRYVAGDMGCVNTAKAVRRAGVATLAANIPADAVPVTSGGADELAVLLTDFAGKRIPAALVIGDVRLVDPGKGYGEFQLIQDGGDIKKNFVASRNTSEVAASTVTAMRLALDEDEGVPGGGK